MKNKSKKKYLYLLKLAFILILNSCYIKNNIIDSSEKWEGLGYQKGINETWKIEITKKSKNTYYVNYPDIPCSGEWIIVSKNKDKIVLKEEIKKGKEICIPATNVVIMKINNENLSVTFFLPENSKEPFAFGTLKK